MLKRLFGKMGKHKKSHKKQDRPAPIVEVKPVQPVEPVRESKPQENHHEKRDSNHVEPVAELPRQSIATEPAIAQEKASLSQEMEQKREDKPLKTSEMQVVQPSKAERRKKRQKSRSQLPAETIKETAVQALEAPRSEDLAISVIVEHPIREDTPDRQFIMQDTTESSEHIDYPPVPPTVEEECEILKIQLMETHREVEKHKNLCETYKEELRQKTVALTAATTKFEKEVATIKATSAREKQEMKEKYTAQIRREVQQRESAQKEEMHAEQRAQLARAEAEQLTGQLQQLREAQVGLLHEIEDHKLEKKRLTEKLGSIEKTEEALRGQLSRQKEVWELFSADMAKMVSTYKVYDVYKTRADTTTMNPLPFASGVEVSSSGHARSSER